MSQKKPLSREAARRKRLLVQKRRRRRITLVAVCCLVLLIVIASAIRAIGNRISDSTSEPDTPTSSAQDTAETKKQEEKEEPEEQVYEPASVSLIAVGDNLIHNTLLKDASNGDGSYDFTSFYENIKPYVEAADIAFVNQESPLGTGEPAG